MKASEIKPGMRFGRLSVVDISHRRTPSGESKRVVECLCDCGESHTTNPSRLKHVTSCYACAYQRMNERIVKERFASYIGKKYRHLTVLDAYKSTTHPYRWRFVVSCGFCSGVTDVLAYRVRNEHNKGCAICTKRRNAILKSQKHGGVRVIFDGPGKYRSKRLLLLTPVERARELGVAYKETVAGAWVRESSLDKAESWLHRSSTPTVVACRGCGVEFTTNKNRKVYCSRRCAHSTQAKSMTKINVHDVVMLRSSGETFDQIGRLLNCSPSGACLRYKKWQKQQQQSGVQS